MSGNVAVTQVLDELTAALEGAGRRRGGGDAIERTLSEPGRSSAVRSLREAPEVDAFRQELIDGLIRVDTANRLLQLLNTVVTRLL